MADCNFEHEREFGKDEAGYRCGARYVHDADAMLYYTRGRGVYGEEKGTECHVVGSLGGGGLRFDEGRNEEVEK